MLIDFEKLVKDIAECCALYHGKCHECPYRYVSLYTCRLQYIDTDELELLRKISKSRGNLSAQNSAINRDFERELHVIKKSISELCKYIDVFINGGKK